MRTKFFFLFAMFASIAVSAQSHINIEMLSATYTASPAVKFRVSWSSVPTVTGQIHNAKVWVWIDFLKINPDNTTAGNTWTRAESSATPAVSSSPTSTAALDASTNKGFWLNGVTGSYSATVTATLSNISANTTFNWCAYASDYPPNMVMDEQTYYFKGTSPFILKEANGTTHEIKQPSMPKANLTFVPVSITDKTECPGGLKEVIGACPYTGTDWYADPNHKCQQRTTGAQNWEAYIKDSRDNQIYRITQFSDANWWFADDLNVAAKSVGTCSGKRYYDPQDRPACPTGWLLPTLSQMCARWATFAKTGSDEYGAPITVGTYWLFETSPDCMSWVGCNVDRWDYVVSDQSTSTFQAFCNLNICTHVGGRVRCFRQL